MAISVRRLQEWRELALESPDRTPDAPCPQCSALRAAVLQLTAEIEQLRAPYARAFRDGASGALEFAARSLGATGDHGGEAVVRRLRAAVTEDRDSP